MRRVRAGREAVPRIKNKNKKLHALCSSFFTHQFTTSRFRIRKQMSSTDTPTPLKRKASSLESDTQAGTGSDNSSQPPKDPKRARQDLHADDCEDEDCEGCAEGEIVLQFDTTPSAVELFQMALEEASKPSTSSLDGSGSGSGSEQHGGRRGLSRMAKALFDKAIEEFEALEKANAYIQMNDGKRMMEARLSHAACFVAVGNYMPSLEMLQEGVMKLSELAKETINQNGNVLVGLGIAEISQVKKSGWMSWCA